MCSPTAQATHERLRRHIGAREKSLESGKGINWGTAEVWLFIIIYILAYVDNLGSLIRIFDVGRLQCPPERAGRR